MVGKIERMDNKLLPKKIMYGTLDHTKIPSAKCSGNLIKKMKNLFMAVVQKDDLKTILFTLLLLLLYIYTRVIVY